MLRPIKTTRFKKEIRLMEKRGKDILKMRKVMSLLINEQPLPERCHPHPLHGNWDGCMDCHVFDDNWVLIYEIDPESGTVTFHRTGSHADLF